MKTAIYVRVSKEDMNPENQKIQLEEYAKNQKWEYVIFEEKESTRNTRPIKEEVMSRLRKREFSHLLVWKLDRFWRSTKEFVLETEELSQRKIDFEIFGTPINSTTATGRMFLQLLAVFAEFERELIRERTKAGIDRAKAQGKIRGRHPVGCGCGKEGKRGKHDGPIKPVRDEHNMITGWVNV